LRPALGGCLPWFLIVIAVLLVVALLLRGTHKGAKVGLDRPAAVPLTLR
jgi:hypothetical protein